MKTNKSQTREKDNKPSPKGGIFKGDENKKEKCIICEVLDHDVAIGLIKEQAKRETAEMKTKPKWVEKWDTEGVADIIYFALTRWDMNPMTKSFAREVAKTIKTWLFEKPIVI